MENWRWEIRGEGKDFPCLKGKSYMLIITDFISNPSLKNNKYYEGSLARNRSKRATHAKLT